MKPSTKTLKQINEAKTWREAENIVGNMSHEEGESLRNALQTVKNYFGITGQDDFYLAILKARIGKTINE